MTTGDANEDATDCIDLNEYDDVLILNISDCNCQPPLNDSDDKPKRGKKGKYLKDWQ